MKLSKFYYIRRKKETHSNITFYWYPMSRQCLIILVFSLDSSITTLGHPVLPDGTHIKSVGPYSLSDVVPFSYFHMFVEFVNST